MLDEHYQNPTLAELYDLDSGWSDDRTFYLKLADYSKSGSKIDILDLGCGTGLLCNAYAEAGHRVVGVDPAKAMLDIARKKPFARQIDWFQSNAQSFQCKNRKFDLIIMTGHAFQVLLEDEEIKFTFSVMKNHLKPHGRVVFESRNPNIDWKKCWNYSLELKLRDLRVEEERRFIDKVKDMIDFEISYKFPDSAFVSKSRLRFLSKEQIESRLNHAGLEVEKLFGDWDQSHFDPEKSEEMIFVVASKPH